MLRSNLSQKRNSLIAPLVVAIGILFASSSWAEKFLVPPQCPQGTKQQKNVIINSVSTDILIYPGRAHNQGNTRTCSFHTTTVMLTSLLKSHLKYYTNNRVYKEYNLNVSDVIDQLNITLEEANEGGELPFNLWNSRKHLFLAIDKSGVPFYKNVKTDSTLELTRQERLQSRVSLPIYNINVFNVFQTQSSVKTVIIDHFQGEGPKLPLGLGFCLESTQDGKDCVSLHAAPIISLGQVDCLTHGGRKVKSIATVEFQNSWGGKDNGPFALDPLAKGISHFDGDITRIEGCGIPDQPRCTHELNEDAPLLDALRVYASIGEVEAIKRLIYSTGKDPNGSSKCGKYTPSYCSSKWTFDECRRFDCSSG